MAETDKKPSDFNFLADVLVPIVATLAAASGPYGQAGAHGLLGALNAGERRRAGRRDERRIDAQLRQQQQAFEAGQPQRDLAAAQAGFQLQNLGDIRSQVDAPVGPTPDAIGALGAPQAFRLQEALSRGEQVPIPQQPPTPELRQQRFQQIAANPEGRAQLTAAGLGDISQAFAPDPRIAAAAIRAEAMRQEKVADRQTEAGKRRFEIKKQAYDDLRQYPEDILPRERRLEIQSALEAAETDDALLNAIKDLPAGLLKPKSARIDEYKFYAQYERENGRQPTGPREFWNRDREAGASKLQNITTVAPNGVDYGKPPQDTAWARNPDGSVLLEPYGDAGQLAPVAIPVRGGKAYLDIQDAQRKEALSQDQARQAAGIVVDTINRAFGTIETSLLPTTGLIGGGLSNVPGTDAYNLRSQLDTIRSNVGFEALQKMRQSSPTGGALGQVSDSENRLLQSVLGSLTQGQSKGELTGNLGRIREIYLDIIHGQNRENRQLQYLTQEDISTINQAQERQLQRENKPVVLDPKTLSPSDLSNMTPEQLDALERQLSR